MGNKSVDNFCEVQHRGGQGLATQGFINKLRQNLTSAKYVIMETRRNYGGNSLDTSNIHSDTDSCKFNVSCQSPKLTDFTDT